MNEKRSKKRQPQSNHIGPPHNPPEPEVFYKSELAWFKLSQPGPEEEDRWGSVEEHLLSRSLNRDHSMRRWKYFSK